MSNELCKLKCLYRIKLLSSRGEEMNRGIIHKLNRKIRKYEKEN